MVLNVDSKRCIDLLLICSPAHALSMHMPYYFLFIAGFLEKFGFTVEIANPHFKNECENVSSILKQVASRNLRYIGMASFCTDYNVVCDLAKKIKEISSASILVGNAQPSISPEDFLYEGSPFDIVVKGEGEETVRELLSSDGSQESLRQISGLAFLDTDGGVVVNTPKRRLMDLAQLAMPAYHLINMDWYLRPTKHLIRRLVTVSAVVYTGRGCPYDCSFCASNVVWATNERASGSSMVRSRPLDAVVNELRLLQDVYGFDFFYILDDTFGLKESLIAEFCDAYRNSGLRMLWGAETRANCIRKPEVVQMLKDAGCIQLDFGVESGSPEMLKSVNKKIKLEHIHRAFDLCREKGVRTFANLLLNLPGETQDDIALSEELLKRIRPTYTSIGLTQPYPGTPMYKSLGLKIDKGDYHLLNREYPVEEFRLCKHRLSLPKLLVSWRIRYGTFPFFEASMFRTGWRYWAILLKSSHRFRYLTYFLVDSIKQPFAALQARCVLYRLK